MLSKMSDLFSFITNGLIKIGAFAFVALLTFEKIGGGTVGSFFGNSTKSVIKMIPVFRSFYIKYGEKNTGSQFVTQYFLILFFA